MMAVAERESISAERRGDPLNRLTKYTYDANGEEKGTGYFSGDVRGRPRGRRVDSRPKAVAITACQSAVPNGCCRFTQVRRAVSS